MDDKVQKGIGICFLMGLLVGLIFGYVLFNDGTDYSDSVLAEPHDPICVWGSDANNRAKVLNHTKNHPKEFSCGKLAWMIENTVYPLEVSWHYRFKEPNCGHGNNSIVSSTIDPNTKVIYDDYYFRKCLTK